MPDGKPFAWSYSVLGSFEDCARRHYLVKVAKTVPEKPGPQMLWGNQVHKALELSVTHQKPLSEGMQQWEPMMANLKAKAVGGLIEAEQKMALSKNHVPVSYFDKQVWVRGITDVTIVKGTKCFIGDYKTGKPTPASAQLALTAAMTMHHKPYLTEVVTAFIWLKDPDMPPTARRYLREDLPAIWQSFNPRVQRLEQAFEQEKWPPKPGGLCRDYCPCTSCEFNGNYRPQA